MAEIGTDIAKAVAYLCSGGLVAIPTETVYGLAANALDPVAVAGIFEAKQRPSFDPLIVHLPDFSVAELYCDRIPEAAGRLANRFCPGPLTFILPKKAIIPDIVTAGHPTVGIRIPRHPLSLGLLDLLDFPLAAPSANPFGYVSPTTAWHVAEQLGEKIGYILDGGPCEVGLESTIIDFSTKQPKVLRLGGLSLESLEEALGQSLEVQGSSSNPKAPGMLLKHYAPAKKMVWEASPLDASDIDPTQIARIRFNTFWPGEDPQHQFLLSAKGDLAEAAGRLFGLLRELDKSDYALIRVERMPEHGLGRAINDRLQRAVSI
ncbi:MAG: L-threonylcarbamoyladenylate synthase [Bacteroidia bacterium]